MREICFIITKDERILRIYTGSATRVPDSRSRWNAIWTYRDEIQEIVHTHPGGFLGFSKEDLTTMEAVESATGFTYHWSIVTENSYLYRDSRFGEDILVTNEGNAWWINFLRDLSFRTNNNPKTKQSNREVVRT